MPEIRDLQSLLPDERYAVVLGSQIRELRKARRWTQGHLGSLLHLSAGQISKYETGTNSPQPATLVRLAAGFGLPVDAVLPEVPDVPLDPVDGELRGYMRRLIALPSREKEAATGLLRVFLGFRDLLLAPAGGGEP